MSLRPSLMWMQPQLHPLHGCSWAARDTEHGLTPYARVYTRSFVFFSVTSVTGLSRILRFLFDYVRPFREIKGHFREIKGHFRKNVGHFRENMGLLGGYESKLFWESWFFLRRNGFSDSNVTAMWQQCDSKFCSMKWRDGVTAMWQQCDSKMGGLSLGHRCYGTDY